MRITETYGENCCLEDEEKTFPKTYGENCCLEDEEKTFPKGLYLREDHMVRRP